MKFRCYKAKIRLLLPLTLISIYIFLYRDLVKVFNYTWTFGELYRTFSFSEPLFIWKNDEFKGLNLTHPYLGLILKILDTLSSNLHLALYLLIPVISFVSFFFLVQKILSTRLLNSFIGSLFYSLNPVIVSMFIVGEFGPPLTYAFQPIILLGLYEIFINHKKKWIFIFPVASMLFFVNIYHAFWSFTLIIIPILIYNFIRGKPSAKNLFTVLKLLVFLLLMIFLTQLPLIIQYTILVKKPEGLSSATISSYSYQDASFINVLRLAGNKGSAQAEQFLNYNSLNIFTIFGYALIFVPILPLILGKYYKQNEKNGNDLYLFNLLIFISYLLIAALIMLIKYYPDLLKLNPIFYSLRNPIKLQSPMALFFSFTFVFALTGIDRIVRKVLSEGRNRLTLSICLLLIVFIFAYNLPALDGTLGLKTARQNFYVDSHPQEKLYTIIDLKKRVLVLPWNIQTQKLLYTPNRINPLTGSIVSIGNLTLIRHLYETICFGKLDDVKSYLQVLDIKYILLIKGSSCSTSVYKSFDTWMVDINALDIAHILESDLDFKKVWEDSQIVVFEFLKKTSRFCILLNYTMPKEFYKASNNMLTNPSFEHGLSNWGGYRKYYIVNDSYTGQLACAIFGENDTFSSITQTIKEVNGSKLYVFSFKFKVVSLSTDFHAKILWFNQTEDFSEKLSIEKKFFTFDCKHLIDNTWLAFKEVVTSPKDAKSARIVILTKGGPVLIDDVEFARITPKLLLYNFKEVLEYKKINPVKYTAKVHASKPFMLSFAEAYDPLWVCYVNGQKIHSIPLYGVINGFYINQTGHLEITIEYEPQRWFNLGCTISLTTLLACTTYVIYNQIKQKRKHYQKRKSPLNNPIQNKTQ